MVGVIPVGSYALGLTFGTPTVLAKCQHNALNALYKRHLTLPPNRVTIPFHPSFLTQVRRKFEAIFKYQLAEDEGKWKARKTTAKLASIEQSHVFDKLTLQRAKSFVKREVSVKVPTKARLIQGNFNEVTAYYKPDVYKAISHLFQDFAFKECGVDFVLRYTSGCTNLDISRMYSEEVARNGEKLYDERDGKNWDSTMQQEHMVLESQVYSVFDAEVGTNHLRRSTSCKGTISTSDYVIKYRTAWKRLSGDWNTSVGNSVVSMAICITAILSLPDDLRPKRVFAMFHGDDYLGVYHYDKAPPASVLNAAMADAEAKCGITPVRNVFTDPLKVEYISLSAWPAYDGSIVFIPKISNMLVRLFHSTNEPCWHTGHDVRATITALRPSFNGLRFVERFFSWHAACWPKNKRQYAGPNFLRDQHALDKLPTTLPSVNWAYGFAHKFRVPITALDFELPKKRRAYFLRHPVVDLIFDCEHADPDQRH